MFLPEITKHSFGPAVTIEQKHMVFVEITFDVKIWLFHKMKLLLFVSYSRNFYTLFSYL